MRVRGFVPLLLVSLLVLSACGQGGQSATNANPSSASSVGSQRPFVVGVTGALTTSESILGIAQKNAVQMAADKINASGGINGAPVKLIFQDDRADPSQEATIVNEFITKDKVDAILGPTNDGTAVIAAQNAEKDQVPLVIPDANGDYISKGHHYVFQLDVASSVMVAEAARHIVKDLHLNKIAIAYDDNAFGKADRDYMAADLKTYNLTPVDTESLEENGQDYTPQLARMKNAGAEVIFAPAAGTHVALMRKNMYALNWIKPIVGPNSLAFQSMIQVGGKYVEDVQFLDLIDQTKPGVKEFEQQYAAKNGVDESGFPVLGYDGMMMLAQAFKEAGHDPSKVADALQAMRYDALSGKKDSVISFTSSDHRRADPSNLVWRVVKDGHFVNLNS